ncbi:MAG: copper chaperone PCu(A)C [Bacteroidota bacterium]
MKYKIFATATILLLVNLSSVYSQEKGQPKSKIQIHDPWIRPAAEGSNTALFFVVENKSDKPDTIYAAESTLSEVVEVHEMFKKGDMMGMHEVEFVAVPAHSKVEFKPRDIHVMLIKTKKDIKLGEEGEAVLLFKNAGAIKVKATVRDMPKMNGMKH